MTGKLPEFRLLPFICLLLLTACTAELQPGGQPVTQPTLGEDHVMLADGHRLFLRRYLTDGPASAVVIGLHGFNDHSAAWQNPAARWQGEGIATYAYDHRGFRRNERPGIWPGTSTLVSDLTTVAGLVRAQHPDTPLYLVGESMGSAVIMAALGTDDPPDVDGAILSAPAVWARPTMSGSMQGLLSGAQQLFPGMKLYGSGVRRQASDNIEMLRGLGRDPLVIKGTRVDALNGLVNLMDAAYDAAPRITRPTLILYGIRDEIVPVEVVRQSVDLFETKPDLAVYKKGWHLLFRDFNGPVVQNDAAFWMLKGGPFLPSNAHELADYLLDPETRPQANPRTNPRGDE